MSSFDESLLEQQPAGLGTSAEYEDAVDETSIAGSWWPDFDADSSSKWHARQQAVQIWLAMPKDERWPRTQRELARLLDVNEMTISRWKKLPGFQEEVTTVARRFLVEDLPDVYAALRKEAKSGSLPHIKVVLELTGEFRKEVPGSQEKIASPNGLSQDVLQRIAKVYGTHKP